ncbi:cupin domain-containing protein [Novosphingobium profundi]|uniref:cupin domain-containing protein n=1 Tax=Novosphingobium profundi TaxID=1774954 RepID=UPI001BD9E76E|nr:cupin domain-containing protein [Novosphingobium profundi]MBT0670472.1 cupin domain-containing protein [Novosphingobium profundi]
MTDRRPARRVVTGHDPNGKSIVLEDGTPPNIRDRGTGVDFIEIWNTPSVPAPITAREPEPTDGPLVTPPAAGGTKIRINDFFPGHIDKLPERADGRHKMMHRTQSVDYGIVLEGEIWMILDDSEVHLTPGTVVIQRGTDHAWENRSDQVCRMAFILVSGEFAPELRATLPQHLELRTGAVFNDTPAQG